jgi:glycosyltransferase involved in cell wall biosynthesis
MMDLWTTVPYYVAYLSRALANRGANVTIGAITYHFDRDCFSRFSLRNDPGMLDLVGKLNLPKTLRRTLKFAETMLNTLAWAIRLLLSRPDVVHVQYLPMLNRGITLDFWFLRYCRALGMKLVYTVHDLLPHDSGERHKNTFVRLYKLVDVLICHAETAKERLISDFGVAPDRIWVIPHGPFFYDFASSRGTEIRTQLAPNGECLVLWQGFIFQYKGIDFLLDAWARVRQAGANARLIIAGAGSPDLLEAIRKQAVTLDLGSSVLFDFRFLPLEEMIALYQAADILVYPYKAITASGSLLTGITQGKAIIATALPTFTEVLKDRENAMLVEYGDTDGLALRLLTLIHQPEIRDQLAQAARALNLGEKAWDEIAKDTLTCYAAAIARN